MEQITRFQHDCLDVIASLEEPTEDAILSGLVERHNGDGNTGRVSFALLNLMELGLVDREEDGGGTNSYSLTSRGEEELYDE